MLLESDLTKRNAEYSELKQNAARSICCRERVDNPNIHFYSVVNGRISCGSSGSFTLSC